MLVHKPKKIDSFDFYAERILIRKYQVLSRLGAGWEGEVFLIRELATGIDRAAKFFYPERNKNDRTIRSYAKKLHKLRHCPILIQYHTQEQMSYRGMPVLFLVSEYVDGDLLSTFLDKQPGKRLQAFQGLHLLHAMVSGLETIHHSKEYHGDLHTDNVILQRYGLGFDLKLVDMYHWGAAKKENFHDDICDVIRIFYDALGGAKHYARQPQAIKNICCGLKRSLILKKFRTMSQLREHLETMQW